MGRRGFDTRAMMTCAAIGVATGLLLIPANVYALALTMTVPLLVTVVYGLWSFPGLLALAVLRRPGTAIAASAVAGLVCVPSTPNGWSVVLMMAGWGLVIELPFLVTRYRREGAWLFVVSGALIGALGAALLLFATGLEQASRAVQVGVVLTSTLSSVAVAVVSLLAARALARAGVGRGRHRPRQLADATVEPAEQR